MTTKKSMSIADVRTNISEIFLSIWKDGGQIIVTRSGKALGKIVPLDETDTEVLELENS